MKKVVNAVLAVILAAGCTACSKKAVTGSQKPTVVRIGTQEMPNDEGIAKELGYFEKELGCKIELSQFDSGKDVIVALTSDSIDFGLLGSCPATITIGQNIPVELIWIHEVLGSVESLAAKKGINTVDDLKGKTIAVPFASTAHFSLLKLLDNKGLTNDVRILDMQPSEIYAAWINNEIDAAYVWEPTLSQLQDAQIVATSADLAKMGYMTSNVELVTRKFADAYPKIVTSYVRALNKSVMLYNEDHEAAINAIVKKLNITAEQAEFQSSGSIWLTAMQQTAPAYLGTPDKKGAIVDNLYETAQFLVDQKSLKQLPDKSLFENAVNPSFINEVAQSGE